MTADTKGTIKATLGLVLMFFVLLSVLSLAARCASSLSGRQKAIQAAEASFESYAIAKDLCVTEIVRVESIPDPTPRQIERKKLLYKLGASLEAYRTAHNTYISALRLGDDLTLNVAYNRVREALRDVINLAQAVDLAVDTWRMP